MTNSKYRYLIPNGITFASLACGSIAIFMAAMGNFSLAGILILASYVLDSFDGAAARKLQAGTEFGLQLDSLVDMVSLGTAPAALAFVYLQTIGANMNWVWPVTVLFILAGAFRLARFNLLPAKSSSHGDSVGLTISTAGAIITLTVLSNLTTSKPILAPEAFIVMIAFIAFLMVSTIDFPSPLSLLGSRRRGTVLISIVIASVFFFTFFRAWLLWTAAYIALTLVRESLSQVTRRYRSVNFL